MPRSVVEARLLNLDWTRRAYQDSGSGRGDVTHWTISNPEFLLRSAGGSMVLFGLRGVWDKLPPLESQWRDLHLKDPMPPDFDRMPNVIRGW